MFLLNQLVCWPLCVCACKLFICKVLNKCLTSKPLKMLHAPKSRFVLKSCISESVRSLSQSVFITSNLQIHFLWNFFFFLFLLPAPCAAFSAMICWYCFLFFCLNSASASSSSTMVLFLSFLGIRE